MLKFGLKLWSINKNYVDEAIKLFDKRVYDYIELFVVPNSYNKFIYLWKDLSIPYIIHAPHSMVGFNLSKKECFKQNLELAKEVFRFSDDLNAKFIIFHPGVDGNLSETINQLNKIKKIFGFFQDRIVVENKPYYALVDDLICNGNSPEDIELIIRNSKVGFCFDIGHAIYSANARKIDYLKYFKNFMKISPKMFHIYDGNINGIYDKHQHFENGNFDYNLIFKILPKNTFLTLETPKDLKNSLNDFEKDVIFIKHFLF